MSRRRGFTLIELLVVIAIIALLMSIMMPALQRVKKQARMTACLANLKNWGLFFSLYCQDNDGYFFTGEFRGTRTGMGSGEFWRETMRPYSKDVRMWCCPQATKPLPGNASIPRDTWAYTAWKTGTPVDVGSYGLNGWVLNIRASKEAANRDDGWGRLDLDGLGRSRHWGAPPSRNAYHVPVFTGSWWVDSWPLDIDQPPLTPNGPPDRPNTNEMERVCVDRHDGFLNSAFADWSVRKVGLKELWTLKWHRTFNVNGAWTKAGGVSPDEWPQWMRGYKDY